MVSAVALVIGLVTAGGGLGEGPTAGYTFRPSYSVHAICPPTCPYAPQAGDLVLFSDTNLFWCCLYTLALTTAVPGHAGIIVPMPDGTLAIVEAGCDDRPWVRLTPVAERLAKYRGTVWIRRRRTPLLPEQCGRLTKFALSIQGQTFALVRFAAQITPFRSRGPLRTWVMGKPKGLGHHYFCSELVIEMLVYAGLLNAATARPAATYPGDIFFDHSPNPYLDRHLDLSCDWEAPARWSPVAVTVCRGASVPGPFSPLESPAPTLAQPV